MIKVSITDEAWQFLTQTGQQLGYITSNKNSYGISEFIAALSTYAFKDDRDYELTLTQQWYLGIEMPRARLMQMSELTQARLLKLALDFDIRPYPEQQRSVQQRPQRQRVSARQRIRMASYGPQARIGPVLEAIGLRWLRTVEPLRHREDSGAVARLTNW